MDTTTVLDKYTQDLANLPLEVRHLMEEIKTKDTQLMDARRRYQSKDSQIHKFIKANGTLVKHPKEQQLYQKIEEEMETIKKIQKEKILLANTALFLVSRHLFNFETDVTKLERDDLLPQVDPEEESELNALVSDSGVSTPRGTLSVTPAYDSRDGREGLRKAQRRKMNIKNMRMRRGRSEEYDEMDDSRRSSVDGRHNEDADNNLYCFCQRVSFGEMIGCDNDDCKYEWFHWSCVGITSPPKDDEIWYCPDCSPRMEKRRKKRKL